MPQRLPDVTLQSGVTVTQTVPFQAKGYIIGNESGLSVTVDLQGLYKPKNLYPGTVDFFPCAPGFSGNILISNVTMLSNVSSWPSSFLTVDMVQQGEMINDAVYPFPLPTRQTTTPTTSGNPIFSATVGFGSSVNNYQMINVYNPANSGFLYEMHSMRVFTSGNQLGMATILEYFSGADFLYGISVPAEPHDVSANPTVSTASVTAQDANTKPGSSTPIEVLNNQQATTLDFLTFPDKVRVWPGNNLTMVYGAFLAVTPGTVVRLTAKWTEIPLTGVLAASGGATTGNILTAANLVNTTNPAGSGVIQVGNGGTSYLTADNQGNLSSTNVTVNGGTLTVGGSTVTKWSHFGSYAITNVSTYYNHNLGVVPDLVLLQLVGGNLGNVNYDDGTMTSTQVKIVGSAASGLFVRGLAIKF